MNKRVSAAQACAALAAPPLPATAFAAAPPRLLRELEEQVSDQVIEYEE